jgi:hypothetical protein
MPVQEAIAAGNLVRSYAIQFRVDERAATGIPLRLNFGAGMSGERRTRHTHF